MYEHYKELHCLQIPHTFNITVLSQQGKENMSPHHPQKKKTNSVSL